ncbi:MAG: hypothetical protein MK213_06025 [Planctomycetes bacterium]|nr:hypothetical protein [Planctomycetota bacterium]
MGPGAGALTEQLLAAGAQVLAVEIDYGLADWVEERFGNHPNFSLVRGDVLDSQERFHPEVEAWWDQGPPPRIVSNLPYAISGPFLGRLPGRALKSATILLQKEVAEKAAGSSMGPLPLRLALGFECTVGRRLPPEVFWPRPQVASAFLELTPLPQPLTYQQDRTLAEILQIAFGQRRKRLLGRLKKTHPEAAEHLIQSGVAHDARPEEVPAHIWEQLARSLVMGD